MKPMIFCVCVLAAGFVAGCQTTTAPVDPASVFARADVDGDGKLSPREANDILIAEMFDLYDTDDGETITRAEWQQYHDDMSIFEENDTNGDGVLILAEVQTKTFRDAVFQDLFEQADANGDGYLTLAEVEAFQDVFHSEVR